jgi:hypothetical protein
MERGILFIEEFARLDFGDIGLKEKPLGEEGLF